MTEPLYEAHSHSCLFCGAPYACNAAHIQMEQGTRDGARCCQSCKRRNLIALDRLETERRRALYA